MTFDDFKKGTINVFNFIVKNLKWFLIIVCVLLAIILCKQCSTIRDYKKENQRLENNLLAANDTLNNYRKNGWNYATMRAMQLKLEELADSLKLERDKEPITIIKYIASVKDTIQIQSEVIHDTAYITEYWSDKGYIVSNKEDWFERSYRNLKITTPYYVDCETGLLNVDEPTDVELTQNIWLESVLYKDKKGYTYIQLKTDYPGCTFNDGTAIQVVSDKYDYKCRKNFGLGLGLHVGYGVAFPNGKAKMSPYIGIGLGLQWNPRFMQF